MTIFLATPNIHAPVRMWINGSEVHVNVSPNSRDAPTRKKQKTLMGYYFDATDLEAAVVHNVSVFFPGESPAIDPVPQAGVNYPFNDISPCNPCHMNNSHTIADCHAI